MVGESRCAAGSSLADRFTRQDCISSVADELATPINKRAGGTIDDLPDAEGTLQAFRNVFFRRDPYEGSLNTRLHTANVAAILNDVHTTGSSLKNEYEEKYRIINSEFNTSGRLKNKLQQEYRLLDYNIHSSLFYAAFGKYTLVLVCVLFILGGLVLQGKMETRTCFRVSVGLIVVYTIILLLNILNNMRRQKTAWKKFEWGTVDTDKLY